MQRSSILHAACASHCEQARNRDFARSAATPETDLAPLHGAAKRSLRDIVGRLDTFVAQESEELFEVPQ